MSLVTPQPILEASAAGNLRNIAPAMSARNASATVPVTKLAPAAADEVAALTAAQMAAHAGIDQAIGAGLSATREASNLTEAR